ncbi:MAG: EthD domain-containing protein [Novosphingobium sp.]|nr:EthD domain-containing protein [Novosphingobium sp.]
MIKLVFMLKRHPDLSIEAFRHLYESRHARLGEKHARRAARYVRRYLEPLPELFTGSLVEQAHDVITELWYDCQADYDADMAHLSSPEVVAEIVADEETIFDRNKHRVYTVKEYDSPCGGD